MISRNATAQDSADLVDMLKHVNLTIAQYAQECLDRGAEPGTVAAGLETAARAVRGWCIGRLGA